jgi:type II secretory pathway predicted ATPase ExeA
MLADVQARFGLARPFHRVGNYETEHQRALVHEVYEVCAVVQTGRLVVVAGLVGSGKTHLLTCIEEELARSNRIAVAKSLAVDKRRTSLPSLIEAMFYDLTPGDRSQVKIPKQPERRERELRDLMRKNRRPVVLIVDEAHELHHKTLTGFKRLMELAAGAGVILSVLLIGHPKRRNDLRRPQMEEIGYRTTTFEFEGVSDYRREFIGWLLKSCAQDGVKAGDLMDAEAVDLLAERLRTALQIEMHLTGVRTRVPPGREARFRRGRRTGAVACHRRTRADPDPQRLRRTRADRPAQGQASRGARLSRRHAAQRPHPRVHGTTPHGRRPGLSRARPSRASLAAIVSTSLCLRARGDDGEHSGR